MKLGKITAASPINEAMDHTSVKHPGLLSATKKRIFALLIPVLFALDVAAMFVLDLQGGEVFPFASVFY